MGFHWGVYYTCRGRYGYIDIEVPNRKMHGFKSGYTSTHIMRNYNSGNVRRYSSKLKDTELILNQCGKYRAEEKQTRNVRVYVLQNNTIFKEEYYFKKFDTGGDPHPSTSVKKVEVEEKQMDNPISTMFPWLHMPDKRGREDLSQNHITL